MKAKFIHQVIYLYVCVYTETHAHTLLKWGFPNGSVGKESACNAGDTGNVDLIPGLGKSPGKGNGNPILYSCWNNPMDRGT